MPIEIRLDVMLALRKARSKDLAQAIGITEQNLSLLKQGNSPRYPGGHLRLPGVPAGRPAGVPARPDRGVTAGRLCARARGSAPKGI
ncbi:helix-turn-helix domain-containing protein [Pseudomonas aeruginosa]